MFLFSLSSVCRVGKLSEERFILYAFKKDKEAAMMFIRINKARIEELIPQLESSLSQLDLVQVWPTTLYLGRETLYQTAFA